jgi:type I restriction enzyme M protein
MGGTIAQLTIGRQVSLPGPPRPLAEIDAELKGVTDRILTMIRGLAK